MRIGVLCVQGSFAEHIKVLDSLGVSYVQLRNQKDLLTHIDGLILPGGESTVQGKLLEESGMMSHLKKQITQGLPVLATCAGMILLAKQIADTDKTYLATLPIRVKRNGFGRQIASFYTQQEFSGIGIVPMTFIRAPYVESVYDGVDILAYADSVIVAVKYENQIACAFHPELNDDFRIHNMFLDLVRNRQKQASSLVEETSILVNNKQKAVCICT